MVDTLQQNQPTSQSKDESLLLLARLFKQIIDSDQQQGGCLLAKIRSKQ